MKKELETARAQVANFALLVRRYPDSQPYRDMLARAQQDAADQANKIGRKNK